MIDDPTLLRRYADERADDAFTEFVQRNLPLVYAAALRRLGGDAHRAEDVAQVVFSAAARDAHRLAKHPVIAGWLYTATRNAVSDVIRSESRRRVREQEAHHMHINSADADLAADWSRLRPVLDAAMDELSASDREAVLLRFFQGRAFAEIGAALGLSEDTARKRVDRALDKLRGLLGRYKIASTSGALAALLAAESITAAPVGLATSIAGAALATSGATVGAALFTFTKLQLGIAAAVVAGGAVGLVTQQRTITGLQGEHAALHARVTQLGSDNAALVKAREIAVESASMAQAKLDAASMAPVRSRVATIAAESAASNRPAMSGSTARSTMANPEVPGERVTAPAKAATRASVDEKAKLRRRYDPFLIGERGMTAEQAERFVELKLAIFDAQSDLQESMRQAGASGGTPGIEEMRSKLTSPMWDEIRSLLGPETYAALRDYEQLSAFRSVVESAFSWSRVSVSSEQRDAVARLVIKHDLPVRAQVTDLGTSSRIDWAAVVRDAESLLAPDQLAALQRWARDRK